MTAATLNVICCSSLAGGLEAASGYQESLKPPQHPPSGYRLGARLWGGFRSRSQGVAICHLPSFIVRSIALNLHFPSIFVNDHTSLTPSQLNPNSPIFYSQHSSIPDISPFVRHNSLGPLSDSLRGTFALSPPCRISSLACEYQLFHSFLLSLQSHP